MKSKTEPTEKNNYIAGPDSLQHLTDKFRDSLKKWQDTETNEPRLIEFGGKSQPLLCASVTEILDYATEYTKKWTSIPNQQKEDFKHIWFIDCRGLYVSSELDFNYDQRESCPDFAPIQFDYSVFDVRCLLFNNRTFLGYAHFFKTEFRGDAHFEQAQFNDETNFDSAIFAREALFSECEFKSVKSASFQQTTFTKRVDFSNTSFERVPLFHETKLPQASSFRGAKFNKSGKGLSQLELYQEFMASRTLRQIAASYKGQQDEAMFFALEQRYYRKNCLELRLVWHRESDKTRLQGKQGLKDLFLFDTWKHWKHWAFRWDFIEWIISGLYDWISEYGSNPTRALCRVININLVALIFYYAFFTFDSSAFDLSKKASILAQQCPASFFWLQNLLNPSAIVSSTAMVVVNNQLVAILAIIQSFGTYIMLALAALAIKTKYQKGGGGDK